MLNSIISEGKTTQEAIDNGLKQLGVSKNQVEIKVIEEKKKSFFSILDPHIVKVEITLKEKREEIHKEKIEKEASEEELEKARANVEIFLNEFLEKLSKEIIYEISTEAGVISVTIKGEDLRINKLSIDSSEVMIEGKIFNLGYSENAVSGKGGNSLFSKIFK